MPVALDMGALYEQMLRAHISLSARADESLRQQVERICEIRSKKVEARKLQTKLDREKQYNRRVELNARLRDLVRKIEELGR